MTATPGEVQRPPVRTAPSASYTGYRFFATRYAVGTAGSDGKTVLEFPQHVLDATCAEIGRGQIERGFVAE